MSFCRGRLSSGVEEVHECRLNSSGWLTLQPCGAPTRTVSSLCAHQVAVRREELSREPVKESISVSAQVSSHRCGLFLGEWSIRGRSSSLISPSRSSHGPDSTWLDDEALPRDRTTRTPATRGQGEKAPSQRRPVTPMSCGQWLRVQMILKCPVAFAPGSEVHLSRLDERPCESSPYGPR